MSPDPSTGQASVLGGWPTRRLLALFFVLFALAACEPKPGTYRTLALHWIAAEQVKIGQFEAALETASLARMTAELSGELGYEYNDSAEALFAGPALAWAGDARGAEFATDEVASPWDSDSALTFGTLAVAHSRAGHSEESKRAAEMFATAVLARRNHEYLRDRTLSALDSESDEEKVRHIRFLASVYAGDLSTAAELAATTSSPALRTQEQALLATGYAWAGDLLTARRFAEQLPETSDDFAAWGPMMLGSDVVGAAELLLFLSKGGSSPIAAAPADKEDMPASLRTSILRRLAEQQAALGSSDAITTAGLISERGERSMAFARVALTLSLAGSSDLAKQASSMALKEASELKDTSISGMVEALLQAASGDMDGALQSSNALDPDTKRNTHLLMAAILSRAGRAEEAIAIIDAIGLPANEIAIQQALNALASGRHDPALFRAAVDRISRVAVPTEPEQLPSYWLLQSVRGALQAAAGSFRDAIDTATGIADKSTRQAALQHATLSRLLLGDVGTAEADAGYIDLAHTFLDDAWTPLTLTYSVGEDALRNVFAPPRINLWTLVDTALAHARIGNQAVVELIARMLLQRADSPGTEPDDSIMYRAIAQVLQGNTATGIDYLTNSGGNSIAFGMERWLYVFQALPSGPETARAISALTDYFLKVSEIGKVSAVDLCLGARRLTDFGFNDDAARILDRLRATAESSPDKREQRDASNCMALALAIAGDVAAANTMLEKSMQSGLNPADGGNYNFKLHLRALAASGKSQEALEIARKGVALGEIRSDLLSIAVAVADAGRLNEALQLVEAIEHPLKEMWALEEIVRHRVRVNLGDASRAAARAFEKAAELADPYQRANALRGAAILQMEARDLAGLDRTLEALKGTAEGVQLPELRAVVIGIAADAMALAGRAAEAQSLMDEGEVTAARIHAGFYRTNAYFHLARAASAAGDMARVEHFVSRADAAAQSVAE